MPRSKKSKIESPKTKKAASDPVEIDGEVVPPASDATTTESPAEVVPVEVPAVVEVPDPVPQEAPTAPAPAAVDALAATPELGALRVQVEHAKTALEAAEGEAKALEGRAHELVAQAKEIYRAALAPYREACKKAGIASEYDRERSQNLSERVSFLVELAGDSVRIAIKGKPGTEELFPLDLVRASPNRTARTYTDRYIGPKETKGNKCGSLGNRLRAILWKGEAAVASEGDAEGDGQRRDRSKETTPSAGNPRRS